MVVGLGIDVVELGEFRARMDAGRLDEFYLPEEQAYARTQVRHWENLGARMAAKRAALRALGDHSDDPPWLEVEVVRAESGELDLRLRGAARERAEALGARVCLVSMTHTRTAALAVVVLEAESDEERNALQGGGLEQHR